MEETPYADPTYYPSLDEEEVEELNNNEKVAGDEQLRACGAGTTNHDIQVQRAGAHEA